MNIAEKLAMEHGLKHRGTDYSLEDAVDAINEALELAAQEAEKMAYAAMWHGSAQDPATAYENGREETAEKIAATIRALKSPAGPVQPSQEQEKSGA